MVGRAPQKPDVALPSSAAPSTRRIGGIQELRGVAVLLVVTVHAIFAAMDQSRHPFLTAIPGLTLFGNSGVDLFFVISGFVMAHALARPQSARSFLVARWRRIWPLYVIAGLIFLALFADNRTTQPATLTSSFLVLPVAETTTYHLPALKVGWTLGFEAMFYLVVALAIAVRRGQVFVFVAMVAAAAASLLGMPPWAPIRMLINPLAAEFALGIGVWLACQWRFSRAAGAILRVAGLGALLAGLTGHIPIIVSTDPQAAVGGIGTWSRVIVWGLPWAAVTLGSVHRPNDARSPATSLSRIGDASYSIYLFHLTVIMMLSRLPIPVYGSVYVSFAIMMIMSVAAGLAAHRWIERPLLTRKRFSIEAVSAVADLPAPLSSVSPATT